MSSPSCKGCGSPIRWITTRAGKAMPVDVALRSVLLMASEPGEVVTIITEAGDVVKGRAPAVARVEGYTPHWATCPNAKQFTRRTKGARS